MSDPGHGRRQQSGTIRSVLREAAMRGEADRYLAATLAPAECRSDLVALAAFTAELARIAPSVSEPTLGAIRLQWWRDALEATGRGEATGHPVADSLASCLAGHELRRQAALTMIDAHERDLDSSPFPDAEHLAHHLDETEGRAFAIALSVLSVADGAALASAAGRAYGLSRRLGLGRPAPDGSRALARAELGKARVLRRALPRTGLTATLPLAMVEPYLRLDSKLQRSGRTREPLPLVRVVLIGLAHVTGRV